MDTRIQFRVDEETKRLAPFTPKNSKTVCRCFGEGYSCLASQFSQNTAAGICVVDDVQAMTKLRNQKKILDFKTLIERNTRNTRIPT